MRSGTRSEEEQRREGARVAVLLAQALTLISTWPLWTLRALPPRLPLLDVPLSCGLPLLISLALTWRWPMRGALVHAAMLGGSVLLDTTPCDGRPEQRFTNSNMPRH